MKLLGQRNCWTSNLSADIRVIACLRNKFTNMPWLSYRNTDTLKLYQALHYLKSSGEVQHYCSIY